ncbi:SDR family NAD(P)-dependent oxidoreductase [Rhodococcus sp. IEGM 1366]|uniref:SDR family NAD(P)-dependent oxidoreductase n=1 Tax=Rhodococcus sp. IEGM 1366 TaxID=3082223 RepID=UPI0029548F7F|nr:SDR family NAD(P)-dependent oxidoreductase [Rhodococcus sp. IEGM 1366]MDV8070666.1 SDR family NAD(P)-dependent oxidoreductase [Rhodococcus sp. IEGM 1366]
MQTLNFNDQVAVVTGAGRGIGLAYAELLASRGARVIVNDRGVDIDGGGVDSGPAELAAESLTLRGYTVLPDTSDISTTEGANAVIDCAIKAFGKIDIVINNAGIYTMDDFPDLDLDMMKRHFDVHIGGSFNVTKAAWPHMVERGYGRIVMTTSTGALGAANMVAYGAAKAGVLGMGRALAQVGEQHRIKVNMIAPQAMSRMMAAGYGENAAAVLHDPQRNPDLVAPMAVVLCHERCPSNGATYLSGMRRNAAIYISETPGHIHPDLGLTPEDILDNWDQVVDEKEAITLGGTMAEAAYHSTLIGNAMSQ